LWAETLSVNIVKGLFDVQFGVMHPLDIPFDDPYYLEMKIDQNDDGDVTDATDEILSPREKLAAVAYAHRSIYSETAGGGTVDVTPRLTGDGSPGDPLDIAQQGAAALDVLTWTGSAWQPAAPTGGGENNYVNATAFNTTNGILTLFRSGLSALNQDLDGRYVENDANGAWVDSTTFIHPIISPTFRIEFDGDLDMGGARIEQVDELSANTIDPCLKIGGKLYRTWSLDMVGQRTEVVGQARLDAQGYFEIDLAQQDEASDLWLFYNAIAPSTIIPFVTPQAPANLFAKIDGTRLIVGSTDNTGDIPFSYRLSGVRNDFREMTQEETNRRTQPTSTFIDIDSGAKYNDEQRTPNTKSSLRRPTE
ncbi:hypothetical protein DRQ36_04030, partial [bacterium]